MSSEVFIKFVSYSLTFVIQMNVVTLSSIIIILQHAEIAFKPAQSNVP